MARLGETAPSLAAQRIWHNNPEDFSLEADIGRYQSTLKYARSTLDYSVAKGLYMLPSNMLLKPLNQVIEGFNDKIIVNTSGFELGKQLEPAPKQAVTKHERKPVVKRAVKRRIHTLDDHQDKVQALVLAIGGLSLFAVWWVH